MTTYIIIAVVLILIILAAIFIKKNVGSKLSAQENMINKHKQTMKIFVISKKKDKIKNSKIPKSVVNQMPKWIGFKKFPLITAKIGPKVTTLICDKDIYKRLTPKKNAVVEVAGIYIVGMKK